MSTTLNVSEANEMITTEAGMTDGNNATEMDNDTGVGNNTTISGDGGLLGGSGGNTTTEETTISIGPGFTTIAAPVGVFTAALLAAHRD